METTKTVNQYGTIIYTNDKGQLHRQGGPAVEHVNGSKEWWINDKLHKENGPAIVWSDGSKWWYLNGEEYTEEEYKKQKKTMEQKIITLENGTTLRIGGKFRLSHWGNGEFIEIIAFGKDHMLVIDSVDNERRWLIKQDWLPYTEAPQKPLALYQKFYGVNKREDIIKVRYSKEKPVNINVNWYSESEAVELGLTI